MASSSPLLAAETDPFLGEEKPIDSIPSPRVGVSRSRLRFALPVVRNFHINHIKWVLPSFLHRREAAQPSHPSSTAWLDGARGLASFFVYIRHFASATHPNIQAGFGASPDNRWIVQLPILHLITAGPAMVALFFIISGYALSYGPLKAMHQGGGPESSLLRLSSATFRRFARLFLPAVVSTFIVALCVLAGLYDRGHASINSKDMPGFWEPEPPLWRNDPWLVQLKDWAHVTWGFTNIFSTGGHSYDVHLWTLPVEFRSSIILFISLVGFARCTARLRAALLFAMVVYCYFRNEWAVWLFFAGSFLCQLKLIQDDGAISSYNVLPTAEIEMSPVQTAPQPRKSYLDVLRFPLFPLGLFLLSAPDYGWASSAPMYKTLSEMLTPANWPENWRFLHCLGGFLLIYSTSSTSRPHLRNLFSNALMRYLGNISYALYLVHGPVVHMLGFWLVPWFWKFTGGPETGMWGKEVGFGFAFVIVTAVTVWCADLFWRGVDVNCVRLAKWVEARVVDRR